MSTGWPTCSGGQRLGGSVHTVHPGPCTNAHSVRADGSPAADNKDASLPHITELCVCEWEKWLVAEFLLPGDIDTAGPAEDGTVEEGVGRVKVDCQGAYLQRPGDHEACSTEGEIWHETRGVGDAV